MKKILLFIVIYNLLEAQPGQLVNGVLRQVEMSFCMDECGEYYIETYGDLYLPVLFSDNIENTHLYIDRYVEASISQEVQCVECSAFEIEFISMSEECIYIVDCFTDPCIEVEECQIFTPTECVANYCLGCFADFYDLNGNLVDCNNTSVEECDGSNPAGCFQNGCADGFECVDDWQNNCVPSACDCDEDMGQWMCTADCNGGTCVLAQTLGDVNNDSQINVLDIVLLVNFILITDLPEENEFYASDVNLDSELNVLDIIIIVQMIINPENSIQINSGTYFGECLGYCSFDLVLNNGNVIFSADSWNIIDEYPDLIIEDELSYDLWQEIIELVDFEYFSTLDDVYGCPDCTDGGAEYIEIIYNENTKHVTFEAYSTIEGIEELIILLRELREEYWDYLNGTQLPELCYLEPDGGPCFGYMPMYYYNFDTSECEMFIYGGCGGVVPFQSLLDCQNTCE